MSFVTVLTANPDVYPDGTRCFERWDDFIQSNSDASGFWIDRTWQGDISKLADQIRSSFWWDRLAFTEVECSCPILDGCEEFEKAVIRIARADLAKKGLHIDFGSLIPAEKLLLYLYVRGDHELIPQYTPQAKSLYVYPIAQYLGANEETSEWIDRLVRNRLLSPARLVNRIRLCKECGSGHVSFVDVCPSCSSIDVKHTPSLHCFTCGHSSRKGDFELEGALVCPKCQARLRHIGVDYDLPTAQYACRKCNSFAMEPRIVAHCLDCEAKVDPDQLDVQEVYTLTLNSRGMEALRQGQFHESFSITDDGNHVIPAYFRHLLDWSSRTQQRYETVNFGVMVVEFTNIPELLSALGTAKVHSLINEYASRMRQMLRESDITCIDSSERLWLLLPFSHPEEIERRLVAKVKEIQPANAAVTFAVRIKSAFAPRDIAVGESSDNIMQALLAR
ncbi:hypothetical protein GCM10027343_14650 [Noviherbaspirillum agri]